MREFSGAFKKFWWILLLVLVLHQQKNQVKCSNKANEESDAQVQPEEGSEFVLV